MVESCVQDKNSKIHEWFLGDVYEWGKVSQAMTNDK